MKKNILFFFFTIIIYTSFAQNNENYNAFSISPELYVGQTFQPNSWFPKLNTHYMFGLSLEKKSTIFIEKWHNTLNLSSTGFSMYFSNFGNNDVVGNAISILPFVAINLNEPATISAKFGLGTSYFTNKYHPINNELNTAVSTDFTWAFLMSVSYNIHLKNERLLKVGLGYFHHSNGHTQLPNSGLNTALASVSTNFELSKKLVNTVS